MKSVVIQSIGEATPSVASVLSDVLSVPSDVVLKLLYRSPSVLFYEVDDTLAINAHSLLLQLGLEASVEDTVPDMASSNQLYDVAVHLTDPGSLFTVSKKLAQFLGCSEQESLQLLCKNPSIVLGSVSQATALALGKRLGTEIAYTNPKNDLYSLSINDSSEDFRRRFVLVCDKIGVQRQENFNILKDLSYDQAQELWRQFGSNGTIELYNQQLLRYNITLNGFDLNRGQHRQLLMQSVGMPDSILEEVHNNLPLLIHEFVHQDTQLQLMSQYQEAGLSVCSEAILANEATLKIEEINSDVVVKEILSSLFNDSDLSNMGYHWDSPYPLPIALCRYLAARLEAFAVCSVSYHH